MSKKQFLFLILICILQIILITGQNLGINVILFMIPFLLFLFLYLKEKNRINNKKGFLLMIPILILSLSYLFYDNTMKYFNVLVIPILTMIMLMEIINPKDTLEEFIEEGFYMGFKPFDYIGKHLNGTKEIIKELLPKKNKRLQRIKSYLIVIPIILIVLVLLSSADIVFASLFKDIVNIINKISIEGIVARVIQFLLLFLFLGSTLYYIEKEQINVPKASSGINLQEFTIKLLLISLNIIYFIFIGIQIFSLGFHKLPSNITYSEYARTGFFQLMLISSLNILIILLTKKKEERNFIKILKLLLIASTYMIIISSFFRMYLYEQRYGYTLLRIGVYLTLVTETILLIPTIFYVLKKDFKIIRYYVMIPIIIYTMINMTSIESIITKRNIDLYDKTKEIDIEYLMNENCDNIKQLIDFYHRVEDIETKNTLKYYFETFPKEENLFLDFNISKKKAYQLLKEELK